MSEWSVVHHWGAGYRGMRNGAATDSDVTVYCSTYNDALEEITKMPKEMWIVEGSVTDPEAYPSRPPFGTTEWQFSIVHPDERGSSADFLSIEEGMRYFPNCIFHFEPAPVVVEHEYLIKFTVPVDEFEDGHTMAELLQRDFYDEAGMSGHFDIIQKREIFHGA